VRTRKLLIITTVPETLVTILKRQPAFLAASLADKVDVELVTSPDASCRVVNRVEGVPVHTVHMARGMSPLADLVSVLAMVRLLLRVRPSIVHSYTAKAGLVAMLAAWICRVPLRIHTFTGLVFPTQSGPKRTLLIYTDRLICACATHVVPEGQGVKGDLERYGVTGKPLKLIGHGNIAGVETRHFRRRIDHVERASRSLARRLGLKKGEFVFCFIGRLNRDKGISELLEAFAGMPGSTRLVLVGALDQTAPISKHDQSIIDAHPRIHATGFLADIRPALCLADILVLPSYREGFPNVVLQASAMEVPVIATDISGSNEAIEPGFNGWLVPPRSSSALRDAMRTALETPAAVRRRMGALGRQRIEQRFEQKQHWKNMVEFYNGLLSTPQKERP
jgi:glycosyltransferase involved in cell wall biosynthesis